MWAKIITIKITKDLNYFSLCALNLFNTQVSQFELNYWNKWTCPRHYNLLRCTCIICNITDYLMGMVDISRKEAKHPNTHIVWAAASREFLINIIGYLVFIRLQKENMQMKQRLKRKSLRWRDAGRKCERRNVNLTFLHFSMLIWGQCFISCNIYLHSVMTFPSCSTGILMGLKFHELSEAINACT